MKKLCILTLWLTTSVSHAIVGFDAKIGLECEASGGIKLTVLNSCTREYGTKHIILERPDADPLHFVWK